ncbi:hypothetical protein AGMMS49525_11960 [Bacteroidia bacterium]|nr:hypothetical protein AGMMS49525_11960 [Bacteroidia bacterium]
METIEKLKGMLNTPMLHLGSEVEILSYVDGVGVNRDSIEIYLSNGKTLCGHIGNLNKLIDQFTPITPTVVALANSRIAKVSSVDPDVLLEIRDTVLAQIKALKNPQKETIAQSKQVFQGVNTLINLAKTELDYRRYMDRKPSKLM